MQKAKYEITQKKKSPKQRKTLMAETHLRKSTFQNPNFQQCFSVCREREKPPLKPLNH